jgi:uncharacterized protein (TIGR00297 family)
VGSAYLTPGAGGPLDLLPVATALAEFFVVVAVALAAVLLNAIDGRGFLASAAVGFAVVYGGGFGWFFVVAVFFILGVAFTLYKYGYKRQIGGAQGKGGARNWPHILANGGLASILAILNLFYPGGVLAAMFLGAVSASAADTAATELGLLSHGKPRLITNPSKTVPPGTSGGVSLLGFVGAAFASMVMGAIALVLGILHDPYAVIPVCLVGGVVGAVADSLVGAAVQRKGYCIVCLKPTEALKHCGERTKIIRGSPYVENNVVNVISTVVGALVALAILSAFSV